MFKTTVEDLGTIQVVRFTIWTRDQGDWEFLANALAPTQLYQPGDFRYKGHLYHVMAQDRGCHWAHRIASPQFRRTKRDAEQLCKRLGGIEFKEIDKGHVSHEQ